MVPERFLSLRNKETNQTQMILVRPETGGVIEIRGRLVFEREGGQTQLHKRRESNRGSATHKSCLPAAFPAASRLFPGLGRPQKPKWIDRRRRVP